MSNKAEHRMGWRGYVAAPRSQLTLWIYIIIVGVLVAFFINAVQREAVRMEAMAVEATLNQMRMQMMLIKTQSRINQRAASLPMNPVTLFEDFPMEYRGEFDREPGLREKGFWYYSRQHQELVYRPNQIDSLDDYGLAAGGQFRFRVNSDLVLEPVPMPLPDFEASEVK